MSAFSHVATTPLHAWPADRLERMCTGIDAVLTAWGEAWGLDLRGESTSCTQVGPQAAREPAVFLGRSRASAAWLLAGDACVRRIHLRLFGRDPSSGTIAEEVAISCRNDFLDRLRALLGIDEAHAFEEPPADAARPWSGWVLACLPLEARLLLSPQAVQSLLGEQVGQPRTGRGTEVPLVPLGPALASSVFRLHAELEGCEVSIDVLRSLQAGDVLRLKQALGAPALVRSGGGHVLFSGFLVRRGGRRALELASHPHGGVP